MTQISGVRSSGEIEIVTIIGFAFAGVAAFGGVAFLTKMAYWQPTKLREEQERRRRR